MYGIELAGIKYAVISGYENLKYLLIKNGKFTYRRNIDLMPPSYDIHNMKRRPGKGNLRKTFYYTKKKDFNALKNYRFINTRQANS